jgi:hypothetical protein
MSKRTQRTPSIALNFMWFFVTSLNCLNFKIFFENELELLVYKASQNNG